MGCLAGCATKYQCGGGNLKTPIDEHVNGPWVEVTVVGGGAEITVGNQSAPAYNNRAVVTSFQYGSSTGSGAKIEIVDEEGGVFTAFFEKIVSSMKGIKKHRIQCQWGWVTSDCNGVTNIIKSSKHYFMLTQVEVRFEQAMKFVLECTDLFTGVMDALNIDKTYGDDKNPMKIKDAINQLCEDCGIQVEYLRRTKTGGTTTWEFKDVDKAKSKWEANTRNPRACIHEWIGSLTTDQDKGIMMAWQDTSSQPTLVLWEDGQTKCDEVMCGKSMWTYVVNGGACSPVIQFNPKIKFPIGMVKRQGGDMDSKMTTKSAKESDNDKCNFDDTLPGDDKIHSGLVTINVLNESDVRIHGKDAAKIKRAADKLHTRANIELTISSIDADLVVQGDPTFDDPKKMRYSFVSIVVINPFHLNDSLCPEWQPALATSACNEVLSNSNWRVQAVSHEIRLGSYTTTIHVQLVTPGGQVNKDLPLGASPNGFKMS